MTIRWFLSLLIVCLSLPVFAQTDDDSTTIYIYVDINPPGRSIGGEFLPGESNFTPEFFEALRATLRADEVNPVFVTARSEESQYPAFFQDAIDYPTLFAPEEHTLSISLLSYAAQDAVYLSPFAAYQFEPLPMGSFGYTAIGTITPDRAESLDMTVELAAGIALYIGRECDKAVPHLEMVKQDAVFIEDGVLLYGSVRFYMASCAYVMGDPETAQQLYSDGLNYEEQQAQGQSTSLFDPRVMTDNTNTNLAWVYTQLGDVESVQRLLDDYKEISASSFTSREMERFLERSNLYLELGDDDAAIAEISDIIDQAITANQTGISYFADDELARLYAERGWRYAQMGNRSAALADFQTAVDTDPTYPKVYFWRGRVYVLMAVYAAAHDDLEAFIALAADYYSYYEVNLTPLVEQAESLIADIEAGLCRVP